MEKLRTCPFCGSDPATIENESHLSIYCPNDNCVAPETGGIRRDLAIQRWNARFIRRVKHIPFEVEDTDQ